MPIGEYKSTLTFSGLEEAPSVVLAKADTLSDTAQVWSYEGTGNWGTQGPSTPAPDTTLFWIFNFNGSVIGTVPSDGDWSSLVPIADAPGFSWRVGLFFYPPGPLAFELQIWDGTFDEYGNANPGTIPANPACTIPFYLLGAWDLPPAPTNLTGARYPLDAPTRENLTWDASLDPRVTSYNIYRDAGLGPVLRDSSATNSYSDVADPSVGYTYTVTAVNPNGESPSSDSFVAPPVGLPKPTGLSISRDTTKVSLTWDTVSGATGYNIYRDAGAGLVLIDTSVTNSYADTSGNFWQGYTYTVSATNGSGEGAQSDQVVISGLPPSTPTGLSNTRNFVNVILTWNAASGATGYNVYRNAISQTSGLLVIGRQYIITTYNPGDDFTNVGAASNASGTVFTATGTTPTTWTHGSTITSGIIAHGVTVSTPPPSYTDSSSDPMLTYTYTITAFNNTPHGGGESPQGGGSGGVVPAFTSPTLSASDDGAGPTVKDGSGGVGRTGLPLNAKGARI